MIETMSANYWLNYIMYSAPKIFINNTGLNIQCAYQYFFLSVSLWWNLLRYYVYMTLDNKYGRLVQSNFKENPTVRVFQQSPTSTPPNVRAPLFCIVFCVSNFQLKSLCKAPPPLQHWPYIGRGLITLLTERKTGGPAAASHSWPSQHSTSFFNFLLFSCCFSSWCSVYILNSVSFNLYPTFCLFLLTSYFLPILVTS